MPITTTVPGGDSVRAPIRSGALGIVCLILLGGVGCAGVVPFSLTRVASDPEGGGDSALSRDGRRVALTSRRGGNWDVWVFDIPSGSWTQVTDHPAEDIEAQWSPDGQQLAFTSTRTGNKDVWVVTLKTGALRQLTDSPEDDEYPSWSPDGRSIVYTGGPWRLRDFFLVGADGAGRRKLTEQPGWAGACSFYPDGQAVLCHRYDFGTGDVLRLPLDGGPLVMLTMDRSWDYKPAASPAGQWVAFSRAAGGGPSAIWIQPVAGGPPRRLSSGSGDDRWPSWDASGQRILFHRMIKSGTGVFLLDRASGQVRRLVGGDEAPLQASLHPDGRRLAFCAERQGRKEIRVLDRSSGVTRTFATGTDQACFPRWSPAGDRLAFNAWTHDHWSVATIGADGTGLRMWVHPDDVRRELDGPLDWSADGHQVLFQADTLPFASDLFVLDTRDGRVQRLTEDEAFDENPAFAAEGRDVLFMSTRGGGWTWGLFRLRGDDQRIETIVKPDHVEKNHLRAGPRGLFVWSQEKDGRRGLIRASAGRHRGRAARHRRRTLALVRRRWQRGDLHDPRAAHGVLAGRRSPGPGLTAPRGGRRAAPFVADPRPLRRPGRAEPDRPRA